MSPDRRANEFQKSFYGRRKHDPKPIKFPEPKMFDAGAIFAGVVLGVILILGAISLLRDHPELDKSPSQIGTVR